MYLNATTGLSQTSPIAAFRPHKSNMYPSGCSNVIAPLTRPGQKAEPAPPIPVGTITCPYSLILKAPPPCPECWTFKLLTASTSERCSSRSYDVARRGQAVNCSSPSHQRTHTCLSSCDGFQTTA